MTRNIYFELTSPNFPSNYYDNINCITTIRVPKGYDVILTMVSFDTEESFDYLDVEIDSLNYIFRSTGTTISLPPGFQKVPSFTARFLTDGRIQNTGLCWIYH